MQSLRLSITDAEVDVGRPRNWKGNPRLEPKLSDFLPMPTSQYQGLQSDTKIIQYFSIMERTAIRVACN